MFLFSLSFLIFVSFNIIMINGSKISVHRFIATTLFLMTKYDHTLQSLILPDECDHIWPYETAMNCQILLP